MDRLAHAFVEVAVGVTIAPQIAETHKKRLAIASAVVVNTTDIDFWGDTRYLDQPVPAGYLHEQLCTDQVYSPEAHDYFRKVRRWSEYTACILENYQGFLFCTCTSLKYGTIAQPRKLPIGEFFIAPYGRQKFNVLVQE